MKNIIVEVMGPEPPCPRCKALKKDAEKAASKLKELGISVDVKKLDIMSKDIIKKYGILVSPALAINGTIKIMGRISSAEEIERIIVDATK